MRVRRIGLMIVVGLAGVYAALCVAARIAYPRALFPAPRLETMPSIAGASLVTFAQADGSRTSALHYPARGGERTRAVAAAAERSETQILFEAPHRIESLAAALASACPDRTTTLCRELTKQFETIATMPAHALVGWLAADANRARGEFVLVLHASPARAGDDESAHDALLVPLLAALPLKHAVAVAAEVSGAPRNALYARALALRGARDEG